MSTPVEWSIASARSKSITQATGDKTPVYYLVARYLGDDAAARDHALEQVLSMMQNLPALLHAAGLQGGSTKGRR